MSMQPMSNDTSRQVALSDGWAELLAQLQDPAAPAAKILYGIAKLRLLLIEKLYQTSQHPCRGFQVRALVAALRGLRTVTQLVMLAATMKVNDDSLDLDGPKFAYVLGEIIDAMKASLEQAGFTQYQSNLALRLFRDNLALKEEAVRRKLAQCSAMFDG